MIIFSIRGEKLAEAVCSHTAFEAKRLKGRHHQTGEPTATSCGFPPRGFRRAVSARDGLFETMDAALGKPGLMRDGAKPLFGIPTKRVETSMAFGPKSHVVDPCSEGRLKSWWNSAVQRTGSTTNYPAIGGWSPAHCGHPLNPIEGCWRVMKDRSGA